MRREPQTSGGLGPTTQDHVPSMDSPLRRLAPVPVRVTRGRNTSRREAYARFVFAFDLSASLRRSGEVWCIRRGMAGGGNRSESLVKFRRPLAIRDLCTEVAHLSGTDRCETKYTRPGDPPLPPVNSSTGQEPEALLCHTASTGWRASWKRLL